MTRKILLVGLLALQHGLSAFAQSTGGTYQNYIDTYKGIAIQQMQKHRIPASIKLAQGLLESAAGQSQLAREGNNHFGIKVGSDWTGPHILRDDDRKNEKFRKYNSVIESFEDHSVFLKKPRYAPLFSLPITDYKGWARTLKKCGYATSPTYAENLIGIIERYNLARFDQGGGGGQSPGTQRTGTQSAASVVQDSRHAHKAQTTSHRGRSKVRYISQDPSTDFFAKHRLGKCNGVYYIIAQPGDDLEIIAASVEKRVGQIRRYNEIPKGGTIYPGQIIYLGRKKKEASEQMRGVPHIVKAGESIYSISQLYAIRMGSIYEFNSLSPDYVPRVGDKLYVCKYVDVKIEI